MLLRTLWTELHPCDTFPHLEFKMPLNWVWVWSYLLNHSKRWSKTGRRFFSQQQNIDLQHQLSNTSVKPWWSEQCYGRGPRKCCCTWDLDFSVSDARSTHLIVSELTPIWFSSLNHWTCNVVKQSTSERNRRQWADVYRMSFFLSTCKVRHMQRSGLLNPAQWRLDPTQRHTLQYQFPWYASCIGAKGNM